MEYKVKLRRANTKPEAKNPKYNMLYIDLGWRIVSISFNIRDIADLVGCLPGELITDKDYDKEIGLITID